ncbi:MAG: response regulator [Chthoniobacterales bacterium]
MSDVVQHWILVVEDHADSAVMLTRLLKRAGYEVCNAARVAEALQIAGEKEQSGRPFDMVLSDLGLPDGTGYELMRQLRDRHHLRGIALSGYGQTEDVRRALEAGFGCHLTKPIDFDKLRKAIEKMLASQPHPAIAS